MATFMSVLSKAQESASTDISFGLMDFVADKSNISEFRWVLSYFCD